MNAIERVCELMGGQTALAKYLDVTPQAISDWVRKGRVPPARVLSIEKAVNGRVTRHELRPDVFGRK